MSLDETVYKEPTRFWPERYLPEHGEPPPTASIFGLGRRQAFPLDTTLVSAMTLNPRRICPGRLLAEASLWIATTTILATFDIVPAKDSMGRALIPDEEFTDALTTYAFSVSSRLRGVLMRMIAVIPSLSGARLNLGQVQPGRWLSNCDSTRSRTGRVSSCAPRLYTGMIA